MNSPAVPTVKAGISAGLRISGKTPEEAQALAEAEASEKAAVAENEAKTERQAAFADRLAELLEGARGGEAKHAVRLAASFNAVADKIGQEFGEDVGASFKEVVLEAAENAPTEKRLAAVTGNFLMEVALIKGAGTDFNGKIPKLAEFLNGKAATDGEAAADSLSGALNAFFGMRAKDGSGVVGGSDLTYFSNSLDWVYQGAAEASPVSDDTATVGTEGPAADGNYYLDFAGADKARSGEMFLPEEAVSGIVEYLASTLGNGKAASYLEENWRSGASKAVASTVAIVLKEDGKAAAADFISKLNSDLAPKAVIGSGEVMGWNLGLDYSRPVGDPERTEGVGAGTPTNGSLVDFWFGDGEADKLLAQKGHQGLLLNYNFADEKTGAFSRVPLSYDLDELYSSALASVNSLKSIDVYV
ncbi:MAG: hypothetical protein LBJ61_03515 [Deltaproteobacteria bacterium]|nr:hypothetical protein [Deltaproteobacteria bacterium]